jgi:hypothetical protein
LVPDKPFCRQCGTKADATEAGESAALPIENIAAKQASMEQADSSVINATLPRQEPAETDPNPLNPICVRCGAEIAAGKSFCRKCGHAIDTAVAAEPVLKAIVEPVAEITPMVDVDASVLEVAQESPQPEPAAPVHAGENKALLTPAFVLCVQCGSEIAAGKPFCRKCGHAVAAAQRMEPLEPSEVSAMIPNAAVLGALQESAVALEHAPAPVANWRTLLPIEESSPHSEASAVLPGLNSLPAELVGKSEVNPTGFAEQTDVEPLPGVVPAFFATEHSVSTPDTAAESADQKQEPKQPIIPASLPSGPSSASLVAPSRVPLFAGIGVAAVVLVAAAVGSAWYLSHRSHQPAPDKSASVKQNPTPAVPKPVAGTQISQMPINTTKTGTTPDKTPQAKTVTIIPQQQTTASQKHDPTAVQVPHPEPPKTVVQEPTPVFAHPVQPAQPRNGVLHYSGPPVMMGGTVVFRNLPKERMHFVIDRSAWQPLIQRSPDGSQTLTLRSIKQGVQTSCDVGWEITP